MKPNELLVDPNQTQLIISEGPTLKLDLDSIMEQQQQPSSTFVKASPARDALSELLDLPTHEDSVSNDFMTGDTNSLIVDLNDLLKRDPTLSTLSEDTLAVDVDTSSNFDFMIPVASVVSPAAAGKAIPRTFTNMVVPNNSPATWTTAILPNATGVLKNDYTQTSTNSSFQPTLAELNSDTIKMETDFDDLGDFFMKNSSPNVTLGVGPSLAKPLASSETKPTVSGFNPSFWQVTDDTSNSFSGSSNPWSSLSSSVPAGASLTSYNISPLSDILTDLNSTSGGSANLSVSPNLPSNSPSHAGPTRTSTLHKLLMRKDQARTGRPSPVRSPEGAIMRPTKTLGVMRSSLSTSNPLLSQQQLSTSAPVNQSYMSEAAAAASGSGHPRVWARREPRPHFSSVCSVGETSTLAEEVNEVLSRMDPNDLQDIVSDDEEDADDDGSQAALNEAQTTDDESDFEGTSPSTSKLNTSGGSSGGNKKERHFWQYNVQAKGPKGQKINFETKIDDPHVLNEIVDPVFSGDVQLQGIKHSGKARRGDGNDLTANPKKLAAIGKELEQLSKIINDLTPVSEMPSTVRCKSRKEKNKLASRACRLKKKAQHEANKLKCEGLSTEHNELIAALKRCKALLLEKVDANCSRPQNEITEEFDAIVNSAISHNVAGNTSGYVNSMIEKHMPYV